METLLMRPVNKEQMKALKAVAKILKIDFTPLELSDKEKTIEFYGKGLVEKIERGEKALKAGQGLKVDIVNLWK